MASVDLRCSCGAVNGVALNVTPQSGNHVVCCCCDCQAFANYVGNPNTLDEHGGTEIFQLPMSQVQITEGVDKLQCMRLTPKGLTRWYTTCCKTPVANTMKASMPFVGLIHTFMDVQDRQAVLGPWLAYAQTQYAKGNPAHPKATNKFGLGITLRIVRKMLSWKLRGMHTPSVFYGEDGRSIVKPIIANS